MTMSDTVRVGDRMYMSLQLAQQFLARQARTPEGVDTLLLEVVEVRTDPRGIKTLVVKDAGGGSNGR